MDTAASQAGQFDTSAIMGGLYGDGIIALQGAFSREWVARLGEDIQVLFDEARRQPGGALERGPNRYYVETHPERLRGFLDLVTHPWVVAVCTAVLGEQYKVVEVGFDIPGAGAMDQPWHRDFPAPPETLAGRRLNSLAFNMTTVDVTEDMGPFEIAPGTQWDSLAGGDPMFPPRETWPRYAALGADDPPRHGQPLRQGAPGVRAGRRCAGRAQRGKTRPAVHPGRLGRVAGERAAAPDQPRGRCARTDRAGAYDRGVADGNQLNTRRFSHWSNDSPRRRGSKLRKHISDFTASGSA
jgi:hypothetical protein